MAPHQTSRRCRHNAGTNTRTTDIEVIHDDVTDSLLNDVEAQNCIDRINKAIQQLHLLIEQQNDIDVRLSRLQQPSSVQNDFHVHHLALNTTYGIRYHGICNVIKLYIKYIVRQLHKVKFVQPGLDIDEMLDMFM